ncbi:MAG TPA: HAD hydrolase-like protein [Patescibacteria group bacterium]|nr:HAD hydrolase-like protein [Patescibacteria group bacterium]
MKIGIDLDDVLADSLPHYLQAFNERFSLNVELADGAWRIADRFPQIPRQEADNFFSELIENGFFSSRSLIPHAKEAVETLADDGHDLYIITGRTPRDERITMDWLTRVGVLSYFEAVVHRTRDPVERHKADVASGLALGLFIEDELTVALTVAEAAIPVLLFDRPWNQGPLPGNVRRVESWHEALTQIAALNGGNGHR